MLARPLSFRVVALPQGYPVAGYLCELINVDREVALRQPNDLLHLVHHRLSQLFCRLFDFLLSWMIGGGGKGNCGGNTIGSKRGRV